MAMVNLSILLLLVLLLILAAMEHASTAETVSALHLVSATSPSIKRFPGKASAYRTILRDYRSMDMNPNKTKLVVAARDYVFQLDLASFELHNSSASQNILKLPTDNKVLSKCLRNRIDKNECQNFMLFVTFNGPNSVFTCGTYSMLGRCWEISADTFKNPKVVPGQYNDNNEFVPQRSDGSVIGGSTANKVILAAVTDFYNVYTTYTLRSILPSGRTLKLKNPNVQFTSPTFISSYEADDGFVYFFFTETAVEVAERQMVYSRVGRVCSYDTGPSFVNYNTFITFLKSQIVCYKKGRIPDYYDHIQSATAVEVHDSTGKSEVYIYASFTTTIRSTGSSAICRYKMKDIQKLFQTSKYYVAKTENGKFKYEPRNHPKATHDAGRMKCDKNLDTQSYKGSELLWGSSNPLLYDDNEPFDKNSVVTFRGERVTSVAVEDIHEEENKTDTGRHVLFAGTDSGKIYKVVMNSTNEGKPVFIEEIQAVQGTGRITKLEFYKNYVIASGPKIDIIKVKKERCESSFLLCSDCIKSRDPYCAWSLSQKKCARAADLVPSDLLQDIATGSDARCPPVDVHISCSLRIVDDVPGARTAVQCTGHGKVAPRVVAWKKGDSRVDFADKNYEIQVQNVSSQLLIIRDYSAKYLGTYECVVEVGRNRSFCHLAITGPTTGPATRPSTSSMTTHPATTVDIKTVRTTTTSTKKTPAIPGTPGKRVNCETDKYLVPFFVCLGLLILVSLILVLLILAFIASRHQPRERDEEDEFDGKKGTLNISSSQDQARTIPMSLFRPRKKVNKTDSSRPLFKNKKNPKNGVKNNSSFQHDVESSKTAKEMDDLETIETKMINA